MKGILFDIDGVLYNADQPIPGAAEAIAEIQARGIPHRFLTNTTTLSRAALVEKLARFGVQTEPDHVIHPPLVAARHLRAEGVDGVALFVTPSAAEDFADLPLLPDDAESGAEAVVVGDIGEAWSFAALNRAFRLLHANRNAELVALGMTRYWQGPSGLQLDVAPFVAALEHAVERRAVVMGKPAAAFFHGALDDLGLPASQVLMVGDDIRTDIGAAQGVGVRGLLVRTGKYRPGDLQRGVIPDAVLDSVRDLPDWWAQQGW